ncbi:3-oxoacyl-[acyl-carrier-protein] synthase III [Magnetococcus marinus MC-1]|uniref:Beta-ketoacyl-[acyl-carrier-protein] synthase III n=1 Tax=Magnetococcus marinus (strain ATCC BAA-1437 / JCM 17883 / MC-1) TaxID=156889 RepID=A0L861_MAGMM|nr:beta-ketoacyl-ACP synthase III [Magnetococcus marinus]ABK44154.1 3-oxoacyl-[acyl-carrier-protein] synthase III [Magnetococcus marinus MC-1]
MSTLRSRIIGTGSYLPERRLTNDELAAMVETTSSWIEERTGIQERRIAAPGEMTSDLAVKAAEQALQAAGIAAWELDLILVATTTPDLIFPSTATIVQKRLGADKTRIPAFDIQAVCTGFIYALTTADQFIRAGSAKRVLVIGAETFSRIINWQDRGTCILFGDGAGAVVLEAHEAVDQGILSTHIYADGSYLDLLRCTTGVSDGGSRVPGGDAQPQSTDARGVQAMLEGFGYVTMRGNEVFKRAVMALEQIVDETLEANNLSKSDVDWLVPHQANIRIINSTAKRLGMSMDQVVVTVERHGNTSAASVPLALDEAVRDGRIKPGQLVLMEAFGGGFTWGSVLVRW